MKKEKKQATISDVARVAGVSIATVSRVLNSKNNVTDATAVKVFNAIDMTGYKTPEHVQAFKSPIILAIIPGLDNPYYSQIFHGIKDSLNNHGYSYIIYTCENVDKHINNILAMVKLIQASGIIVLSPVGNPNTINTLNAELPVVQCSEYCEDTDSSFVAVDDFSIAKNITEYLLMKGKKRIAVLSGPSLYRSASRRCAGYCKALLEAGFSSGEELIYRVPEFSFEPALSVARQMLSGDCPPDSVIAVADIFASAIVKVATGMNINLPNDLSVVGFDDTYISLISQPSTTSVRIPRYQLGYSASEILVEHITNPYANKQSVFLDTEIVLRNTL